MQLLLKLHECFFDVIISAPKVETLQRRTLADQLSPGVKGSSMFLFISDSMQPCLPLVARAFCRGV